MHEMELDSCACEFAIGGGRRRLQWLTRNETRDPLEVPTVGKAHRKLTPASPGCASKREQRHHTRKSFWKPSNRLQSSCGRGTYTFPGVRRSSQTLESRDRAQREGRTPQIVYVGQCLLFLSSVALLAVFSFKIQGTDAQQNGRAELKAITALQHGVFRETELQERRQRCERMATERDSRWRLSFVRDPNRTSDWR